MRTSVLHSHILISQTSEVQCRQNTTLRVVCRLARVNKIIVATRMPKIIIGLRSPPIKCDDNLDISDQDDTCVLTSQHISGID